MADTDFARAISAVNARAEELLPDLEAELTTAYATAADQAAGSLTADATWHKPDADEVYDQAELRQRIEDALHFAKGELDSSIAQRLGAPPGDYDVPGIASAVAGRHREAVQQALLDGWNEGKSVDQMTEILHGIGQSSPALIARTSMNGMSNATSLSGAHYAEVEVKEWLTAEDDRVRDTHAEIDGEQQPVTGIFTNGCRFPGDPNGPPEEVWNCRCTLVYPEAPLASRSAPEEEGVSMAAEDVLAQVAAPVDDHFALAGFDVDRLLDMEVNIGQGGQSMFGVGGRYNPSRNEITLAAGRGAEETQNTYIHEMGHAVDHNFGGLTQGDTWTEFLEAYRETEAADSLRAQGNADYWFSNEEIFARSFNQYVTERLADEGSGALLKQLQADGLLTGTSMTSQHYAPLFDLMERILLDHDVILNPSNTHRRQVLRS